MPYSIENKINPIGNPEFPANILLKAEGVKVKGDIKAEEIDHITFPKKITEIAGKKFLLPGRDRVFIEINGEWFRLGFGRGGFKPQEENSSEKEVKMGWSVQHWNAAQKEWEMPAESDYDTKNAWARSFCNALEQLQKEGKITK